MLIAEFVEAAVFLMLPVVLIAGLVALLLSGLVTVRPASPVARAAHAALALVLATDSILLVAYASGEDTYYRGGVSRWEHADRFAGSLPSARRSALGR